jgi:putative transposase
MPPDPFLRKRRRRKCLFCNELFVPDPRNASRQKACGSRITNTPMLLGQSNLCNFHEMSLLLQLLAQFLRCLALLCRKDGFKAVVAQNLLLKQQLTVLNRGRKRAPSISPLHRIWLAFLLMFLSARHLQQTAVAFRPSTFLRFKEFLVRQKYKFLFSSGKQSKPGPKGPSREIIAAVVEFKQRNPRCGCPRIA